MHSSSISISATPLPLHKHQLQKVSDERFRHIEGLKQFYIPKIPSVAPPKLAPSYERNRRECDEWTVRMFHRSHTQGQKRCMVKEKLPLLIHLCYPEAVESRLVWLTKLLIWFAIFDNDMDNMEQLGSNLESTVSCIQEYAVFLESGKVTNINNHLLGIFASLWQEAKEIMPPHHYARFQEDTLKMFQAAVQQNKLRSKGQVPGSIHDLLAARREAGYFTALKHLVEFMIGMDVDDEIKKAAESTICDDYATLSNDILSLRLEYLNKDYHNVPCTHAILNSVSLDEAIRQTTQIMQGLVHRYNQVRDSVLQVHSSSREARAYMDALGYAVAGNLEWSWQTGRYHGPDWVAPLEREGIMYLTPGENATFMPTSKLV